jgi:hypothetical protein
MSVVTQTPYSPDSDTYDLFLFRRVKLLSRGLFIEDISEILKKSLTLLFTIPKVISCDGNNPEKIA